MAELRIASLSEQKVIVDKVIANLNETELYCSDVLKYIESIKKPIRHKAFFVNLGQMIQLKKKAIEQLKEVLVQQGK